MVKKKGFFFLTISVILFFICIPFVFSAEKLITIEAENTEIAAVIKAIAKQAGINHVITNNVIGQVTLALENVAVTDALDAVLKPNNYMYFIEQGILNVYSNVDLKQNERFAQIKTKVYTLNYADVLDLQRALLSMKSPRGRIELNEKANQIIISDTQEKIDEFEIALQRLDQEEVVKKFKLVFANAQDIRDKLRQFISEKKGKVFVDSRTNSIVVKATPIILKDVDELINGWDVKSKQVLIEAKIFQVTLDDTEKTGIDWEYVKGKYDLHTNFSQSVTTGGVFQVGALNRRNYKAILEFLQSTTDTDVLSSPRIVVMDGKEASILVGSSEPYTVQQKDVDTGLITTETKFLDVGIKLNVTPQITEDNFVIMKIHPEVSSARRVAEVDNALAIDTTEADTTMMVQDGDTVILGGLIKDSDVTTVNKLPILGDIPVLGLFFKSNSVTKVKQEIIVFITPHISNLDNNFEVMLDEAKRVEELTKRSIQLRQEIDEQSFE
ncbi:MAG: secretin N-terminal domain-containing protein [Candidatus Omnitrophota bacterium]